MNSNSKRKYEVNNIWFRFSCRLIAIGCCGWLGGSLIAIGCEATEALHRAIHVVWAPAPRHRRRGGGCRRRRRKRRRHSAPSGRKISLQNFFTIIMIIRFIKPDLLLLNGQQVTTVGCFFLQRLYSRCGCTAAAPERKKREGCVAAAAAAAAAFYSLKNR